AARLWSGFGLFLIRIFLLGRRTVLVALRQRVIGDVANNNQNKKADYSLWQCVSEMRWQTRPSVRARYYKDFWFSSKIFKYFFAVPPASLPFPKAHVCCRFAWRLP